MRGGEEWVGDGEDFVVVVCAKNRFFCFSFAVIRNIGEEGDFTAHTGEYLACLGEGVMFGVGIFTVPEELRVCERVPGGGFWLVEC